MNQLEIDFNYLLFAWEDDSLDAQYYLDSDTGSVVLVQRDLEDLDELREDIELHPNRFLYVPKQNPEHIKLDLSDFIFTVSDANLKMLLQAAFDATNYFDSCKRILREHPTELARWEQWKSDAARERIRKWLAAHDLQAV